VTGCAIVETLPLFEVAADEGTLDERIASVWEALSAHQSVECPICGGEMRPEYGAHAHAIGGKCASCGSSVQ
jgi:hypothetical protein